MRDLLCLAGLFAVWALSGCATTEEIGVVDEGSGMVRMAGTEVWKTAEMGSIILKGDDLKTDARESLVIRVADSWFVLNENTRIRIGEVGPDGTRSVEYRSGDLFVVTEKPEGGVHLSTGAGKVVIPSGVGILRLDPLDTLSKGKPGSAPKKKEMRLQVVVIRGTAVMENLGLARRLQAGELGFLITGTPPSTPTALSPEVVEDFEWALDRAMGRETSPPWARPPLFRAPSPSGEEEGAMREGDFEVEKDSAPPEEESSKKPATPEKKPRVPVGKPASAKEPEKKK